MTTTTDQAPGRPRRVSKLAHRARSETAVRWIFRAAAVVVPPVAVVLGHFAGATWRVAALFGVLALLAVYLSSFTAATGDKAAELGRGLVVTVLLTVAVYWVQHQDEVQAARDSLAFSLSSGVNFVGIELHEEDLSGFYLGGRDFSDADLAEADLSGAVLREAVLRGADLSGADLSEADLSAAYLDGSATDLSGANLGEANLTAAHLQNANLNGADLSGANLSGANLFGADLRGADLTDALLAGADLRFALLDATLAGTVFSADLRDARLDGAGLREGSWDGTTVWPRGFDADRAAAEARQGPPPEPVPTGARPDRVTEVVDGDTVILEELGGVRLLGIDAPQAESRARECYGASSARDVMELLPAGVSVQYTLGDPGEDKFGRMLAYVWLPSGDLANEVILERGDARVLISPPNTRYADRFRAAAVRAGMSGRGLWSACRER